MKQVMIRMRSDLMRKTVLYIAMSLDGYIADQNGKVDWLSGQEAQEDAVDSYQSFIQEVDTIIMGWNTYHQIVSELSPDDWVYDGLFSYVVTHHDEKSTPQIQFINAQPCDLVKKLKQESGKKIWICGGANIVQQLMKEDLIDEYDISMIPTILGSGIRLFDIDHDEMKLKLVRVKSENGITELVYERL